MGEIKEIKIENRAYYFLNDVINIEDFNSSLLKIDKKSYKKIGNTSQFKKLMIMRIFTAKILCIS